MEKGGEERGEEKRGGGWGGEGRRGEKEVIYSEQKSVVTYQRKMSVMLQHGPNMPINPSEALLSALLHTLCFPHLLPCHWGQNMLLFFLRS